MLRDLEVDNYYFRSSLGNGINNGFFGKDGKRIYIKK